MRAAFQSQSRTTIRPPRSKHGLTVADGPVSAASEPPFGILDHLADDLTPSSAYAWPASLARDLNRRFDETLSEYFSWDFFVRAAAVCGIAASPKPTSIQSTKPDNAGSAEWVHVRSRFDSMTMLLPAGSATDLAKRDADRDSRLTAERNDLISDRDQLQRKLAERFDIAKRDADRDSRLTAERNDLISDRDQLQRKLAERYDISWWRRIPGRVYRRVSSRLSK